MGGVLGLRRASVLLLVAACVSGCAGDESVVDRPAPAEPDVLGPYSVGVTTLEVESEGRILPVDVWYPAGHGGSLAEYVLEIGVLELARLDSPLGARRDAPLDRRGAPYPALVFSHGNGGVRFQSVYLTEYLATHGFVVAAPDHVGNTFADLVNSANALPPAEAARVRPLDISRALDVLLASVAASGDRLHGAVDPAHVGVAGHSFGAYTALRVAGASMDTQAVLAECAADGGLVCDGWQDVQMPASQLDARFSAALAQAPGGAQVMFAGGRNGFSDVAMPTMIQGGTLDQTTPFEAEQRAPFEALPSPAWLVAIDKAGHFTFSDMCLLVQTIGLSNPAFQDGCGPDNVPYPEAHALIDGYATAFLQSELQGLDRSALLEAPAAPSGVAELANK
jgi:predicted dienelactone hydrolase